MWGTTTVQGVEVLNSRRHYHKASARPENYEKLFKFLKVYEDIKDYEGEGIRSAWFTLNKSNGPASIDAPANYVADNLNRMWWDTDDGVMPEGLTLTTTITIAENFSNSGSVSGIDWTATKEDIAQYVRNNYEDMWANKKILQEGVGVINKGSTLNVELNIEVPDEDDLSPDDPWLAILSRYALRASGVPCTIKDVEVGLGTARGRVYNTAVVTLEIPYKNFTPTSSVVERIAQDLSTENFPKQLRGRFANAFSGFSSSNENITQSAAKSITYYEPDDDDEGTVTRSYLQWEDYKDSDIYENYWIKDGDIWYLKADVIVHPKNYGTTHVKLNSYIFSLLDTGYKKKKVPVWKKIVAVVVFIVAVVLSFIPGGQGVAAYAYAAAYAVLAGALVVSLVIALTSALGMADWASAFAWVSKEIEPLVTVATIIVVVDVLSQAGEKIASMSAEEGAKAFATEVANFVFPGFKAVMTEGITTSGVIKLTNSIVNVYATSKNNELEKLSDKNKDLKAEYEKLAEEGAMESDIVRGYMNIYAKPATADWSYYASTYDLPYERGGGTLSMGNIQKTTKKSLRPADYEEPMFEGFLLV